MTSGARYSGIPSEYMRIAVGGCGRTGAAIAEALIEAGCHVLILDIEPSAFRFLPDDLLGMDRIQPLIADITLESQMRAVGVQDADAFIVVTGKDTINAVAAQIAFHILRVSTVICRLDDPIKRKMYEGLDIVALSCTNILRDMVVCNHLQLRPADVE